LQHDINRGATEQTSSHDNDDDKEKEELDNEDAAPYHLSSTVTAPDHENHVSEIHSTLSRTSTQPYTRERFDVEEQLSGEKTKSIALAPTKTSDNTILVDWYSTTDAANPQNWHTTKKSLVLLQLCAYSLAVYGASSMYVPGEEGVMKEFHVGVTPAALGLAIYVVGYGVGPLIFAPLSEIAAIGRNWVYIPTFFLFVILSIPAAVVKNYAGLLILRFLTGFFGSPCLANGGASVGDMVSFMGPLSAFWRLPPFNNLTVFSSGTPNISISMDSGMLLGPSHRSCSRWLRSPSKGVAMGSLGNCLVNRTNHDSICLLLSRDISRQHSSTPCSATAQENRPSKYQIPKRDCSTKVERFGSVLGCYH
jgi:hypothetical protein